MFHSCFIVVPPLFHSASHSGLENTTDCRRVCALVVYSASTGAVLPIMHTLFEVALVGETAVLRLLLAALLLLLLLLLFAAVVCCCLLLLQRL